MEIASAWIKVYTGHEIPIEVTPAEAVVLNIGHEANANGVAVHGYSNIREIQRTDVEEIRRLKGLYHSLTDKNKVSIVEKTYPGVRPTLPKTFKEAGLLISKEAGPNALEPAGVVPVAKPASLTASSTPDSRARRLRAIGPRPPQPFRSGGR